jgi:epoxyqueuosine reductase
MILDEVLKTLKAEQIPVWGLGSASRLADEPVGHRPEDLLPDAQSLICFGTPLPRAVYVMPTHEMETVWRSQNLLYRRLDTISMHIAALLEQHGASALPTFGCIPLDMNKKGMIVGYLNQIRMAEVSGLGIIGKNGLLLHSKFGARLMLGGVITNIDLPEIRGSYTQEPGCPPDCRVCVDACPVNAIMGDKKQVKIMRCLSYTAQIHAMSRLKFALLRMFSTRAAARYLNVTAFDEHTFHACSRCVSLCPYGSGTI